MSKRLGNVIDPFATLEKYGADAPRWYMMTNAQPWDNLKFDIAGVEEVRRKFFGTLYNTYSFFALYANIDGFAFEQNYVPLKKRPEIDRWIISLLNSLIKKVDEYYADYDPTGAGRAVQAFVEDHLSNWYVRLCRRRFWKGEYKADKISAYQTLYECMETITKLMAPIAPFFADRLYKDLNSITQREQHESVHLSLLPTSVESAIDLSLEERMAYAQKISSLVLSLRKKENIRVRQPLQKILLPILDDKFEAQVKLVESLVLSEVNIKGIEYITDTTGVISKRSKANFKTLGKKLGKHMKGAAGQIAVFTQEQIADIEKQGTFSLTVEDETYNLGLEDIEITADEIPGWQVASEGAITVALDVMVTDELRSEGIAREIVNRIQNLRKQADFDVMDRIFVRLGEHPLVQQAVADHGDYIKAEVLADLVSVDEGIDSEAIELVEGVAVPIRVSKS